MITVIFQICDDEMALARALLPLVAAATDGFVRDVIVVDGGSQDATLAVADAAGCTIVAGRDGLKQGAAIARGEWLLFLSPAKPLSADWQIEARAAIEDGQGSGRRRRAVHTVGRRSGLFGWLGFPVASAGTGLLVSREVFLQGMAANKRAARPGALRRAATALVLRLPRRA